MTKIAVMSDLHFEFHRDYGQSFVALLDPTDIDILILAGDISNSAGIADALKLFAQRYKETLYISGNHEYYHGDRIGTHTAIAESAKTCDGKVKWLNNTIHVAHEHRFLGTTLWFNEDKRAPKHQMNDFRHIRDFESWVYEENRKAVQFLRREMQKDDIVITHYLPPIHSIHSSYIGSPLNAFFVHDMTSLIEERRPKLWVHGHTHHSVDTVVGETRVVCNPFGYARYEENSLFNEKLVIDV